MYEIAISPNSRTQMRSTRYDGAAGFQFQLRPEAEKFCRQLNLYCFQQRFVVIRVDCGDGTGLPAAQQQVSLAA